MDLILNVISPHRDDAALSLGGTLAKLKLTVKQLNVISCFTITDWAPFLPEGLSVQEITLARQREDENYIKLLGEKAVLFDLFMLDSPLRSDTIPAPISGYAIFGLSIKGLPELKRLETIKTKPILIKNENDEVWMYGLGKGGVAAVTKLDNKLYKNFPFTVSITQLDASKISNEIYEDIISKEAHIPRSAKPDDGLINNVVKKHIASLEDKLKKFIKPNVAWAIPMALGHRDHFIARTATLAIAKETPFFFYEEIPYALYLPETEIFSHVDSLEKLIGKPLKNYNLTEDIDIEQWKKIMRCYPSQFLDEQVLSMAAMLKSRGGERIWVTPEFDFWQK